MPPTYAQYEKKTSPYIESNKGEFRRGCIQGKGTELIYENKLSFINYSIQYSIKMQESIRGAATCPYILLTTARTTPMPIPHARSVL